MKNNQKSKDFRFVYANGLAIQFGNEVMMLFGIREDQSVSGEDMLEEVGIVMTPMTAKALAISLSKTIDHFERSNNVQIPVDASKMGSIDEMLKAADLAKNKIKS